MNKKGLKLNLGCGNNKLTGYVNIDIEASVKPDVVCNFMENPLPYKVGEVDRIVFFHCIEHINKKHHHKVLREFARVLKPGGRLLISFPEFTRCVDNWVTNKRGLKDFWEKTIFGRQLYPSDYHVCIMHTPDVKQLLAECGFKAIEAKSEEIETHNTVITAVRNEKYKQYEKLCEDEMKSTIIVDQRRKRNGKKLLSKR